MIAVAVSTEGMRELLGVAIDPSEAEFFWTDFPRLLTRRGLRGVKLMISDAHELAGVLEAAGNAPNAGAPAGTGDRERDAVPGWRCCGVENQAISGGRACRSVRHATLARLNALTSSAGKRSRPARSCRTNACGCFFAADHAARRSAGLSLSRTSMSCADWPRSLRVFVWKAAAFAA